MSTSEPRVFRDKPDQSYISFNILYPFVCCEGGIFNLVAKIARANLHSQTLLLYLNTAVYSLADYTRVFITTNLNPSGRWTGVHLIGWNWIYKQKLVFPMTEIDWSIPPDAVPVYLYPVMHRSIKSSFLSKASPPLAWRAAKAAHTHKADELETPAAFGTFPSMRMFNPTNFYGLSPFTPARYPALKYFT